MERLSDFKPLNRVTLPVIGDLRCSGLIVLVGPNSAGKTQLLQDLYGRLCGEPRRLVVATNIRIRKPDYQPFMKCLEDEGYFVTTTDQSGTSHLKPQKTYVGTGQPIQLIEF